MVPYLQHALLYTVIAKILSLNTKIRIVSNQDNILSFENRSPYTTKILPQWLITIINYFPIKIITPTKYIKSDLIKNYNIKSDKIVVISNWTIGSTSVFKKTIDCIYCGRFSRQKRLDLLLQVFTEVKKTLPEFKALLIGDGKEKNSLRTAIIKNALQKNVHMLPPTHSISTYLTQSKLFILTSEFEGLPMSLLEAMAVKTVPVILEYPGVYEYIHHKTTGYIEKTPYDMGKRVEYLLKNDKKRDMIGKHAYQDVFRKYNVHLITKTLSYL